MGFNISAPTLERQIRLIEYKYNHYQDGSTTIFEEGLVEEALVNFCIEKWGGWYSRQKEMALKVLGSEALKDIEQKYKEKHEEWVLNRRKKLKTTKEERNTINEGR